MQQVHLRDECVTFLWLEEERNEQIYKAVQNYYDRISLAGLVIINNIK